MGKKRQFSIIQIQKWLQSRVSTCSLCGSSAWELEPELFSLRLAKAMVPARSKEAKHMLCVILTCKDCGHAHFIDADRLMDSAEAYENENQETNDINIKAKEDNDVADDRDYVAED